MVAMRLATDGLGRGGSQRLSGHDGGEEAQEGDSEGGGLHLDLFFGGVEVFENEWLLSEGDSKVRMRMQEQQREAVTGVEGSFICRS